MARKNKLSHIDPFDAAVTSVEHVRELLAAGEFAYAEQVALNARLHVARVVGICRKATLPARKAVKAAKQAERAAEPVNCDRCGKSFTKAEMIKFRGYDHCPDCDQIVRKNYSDVCEREGY